MTAGNKHIIYMMTFKTVGQHTLANSSDRVQTSMNSWCNLQRHTNRRITKSCRTTQRRKATETSWSANNVTVSREIYKLNNLITFKKKKTKLWICLVTLFCIFNIDLVCLMWCVDFYHVFMYLGRYFLSRFHRICFSFLLDLQSKNFFLLFSLFETFIKLIFCVLINMSDF